MTGKEYYKFLLERYTNGISTEAEVQELFDELSRMQDEDDWIEIIEGMYKAAEKDPKYNKQRWEPVIMKIWNIAQTNPEIIGAGKEQMNDKGDQGLSTKGIGDSEYKEDGNNEQGTRNDEFRRKGKIKRLYTWKWIAAASIIGFVVWSLVFVVNRNKGEDLPVAVTPKVEDVKAPELNRAMITLADGRVVYLDSVGNGELANVSGVEVMKMADGKIVYKETVDYDKSTSTRGDRSQETVYNTLTNPRGSKVIDVTLSDGSRVWLNSGSSLRYPVVFNDDKREVEISGEGYFEVAKREYRTDEQGISNNEGRKSVPFLVRSGEMMTEVLGTHFNVKAYEDEDVVRVTLLEGSVNVKRENVNRESVKLIPGQQAILHFDKLSAGSAQSDINVENNVDTETVMAWRYGRFAFSKADIKTVMREIGRWYDLEVVYEGKTTNDLFGGDIQRDLPLSKTLDFLRKSGVDFEVEGRKVVVKGGR